MSLHQSEISKFRTRFDPQAATVFLTDLPPTPKVLDAGCGIGLETAWFQNQGCKIDGIDLSGEKVALAKEWNLPAIEKDLRLFSSEAECYDGIWCSRAMSKLSIEDCQRVLQIFFRSLKSNSGRLFLSFDSKAHKENSFLSLLRQSGFTPLHSASRTLDDSSWVAVIAKRA